MLLVIAFTLPEHDVLSVTKCIFICCQCLFVTAVIMISCGGFLPTQLFHSVFNFQWPHSCNHIPRTGRDGVALASPLNILILKLNNRGTIASSTILRHLKPFQSFLNYNSTSICITYFKPMSSIRNSCFERVWNYGWILNGCGNVEDFKELFLIFLELLACTGRFSHLWSAKNPPESEANLCYWVTRGFVGGGWNTAPASRICLQTAQFETPWKIRAIFMWTQLWEKRAYILMRIFF